VLVALAVLAGIAIAYALAHWALIETGREVIVLRTESADGTWLESRLWIVDDGEISWLHGDTRSRWVGNLSARPIVEVVRAGETRRYRATPVPGDNPRVHELLRAKYGVADRWVRFVGSDRETTVPVRLEPLPQP
jgi:hypothetical protein